MLTLNKEKCLKLLNGFSSLENQEKINPQNHRRQRILSIRTKRNETEVKKVKKSDINITKGKKFLAFYKKINKVDNPLVRLRKKIRINKIRNEKGDIISCITEIQWIRKDCCGNCVPTNWKTSKKWTNSWVHP